MGRLREHFLEWTSKLDPAVAFESTNFKTWLSATPALILLPALGAWVPGTRDVLAVEPLVPLALGLGILPISAIEGLLVNTERPSVIAWLLSVVLGASYVQLFPAALVAFSGTSIGVAVYAAILLFTVAYHSQVFRVTPRHPYLAFGSALACAVAAALNPTHEKLVLFAVLGPLSFVISLMAGQFGDRMAQASERILVMHRALAARDLEAKQQKIVQLQSDLLQLLGAKHDLNNMLTTSMMSAEMLTMLLRSPGDEASPKAAELAAMVASKTRLMVELMQQVREVGVDQAKPATTAEMDAIPVTPTVEAVRREIMSQYAGKRFTFASEPANVLVRGGPPTLHRILSNLLLNACQGDGRKAGSNIELQIKADGATLRIAIIDDGPGFSPELLVGPAELFKTTKRDGHGVGLATVESLVFACAGEIHRSNRDTGGARVDIVLHVPSQGPSSESARAAS